METLDKISNPTCWHNLYTKYKTAVNSQGSRVPFAQHRCTCWSVCLSVCYITLHVDTLTAVFIEGVELCKCFCELWWWQGIQLWRLVPKYTSIDNRFMINCQYYMRKKWRNQFRRGYQFHAGELAFSIHFLFAESHSVVITSLANERSKRRRSESIITTINIDN